MAIDRPTTYATLCPDWVGVCCSAASEQALYIGVQILVSSNLNGPCGDGITNLLCVATCYPGNGAFVNWTVNATNNHVTYISNVTNSTAYSIFNACQGHYLLYSTNQVSQMTIDVFFSFLGGPAASKYTSASTPSTLWNIVSDSQTAAIDFSVDINASTYLTCFNHPPPIHSPTPTPTPNTQTSPTPTPPPSSSNAHFIVANLVLSKLLLVYFGYREYVAP